MDEDEDDFLYGGDGGGAKENVQGVGQEVVADGIKEEVQASNGQEEAGSKDQEDDGDEDEDDEEDDDSDSDLEIIVDGSVGAGPPVGYNPRQPPTAVRPTPVSRPPPSIITSDYTPNARPGQAPSAASLAALAGLEASTTEQASASGSDLISMNQLPEGGPPPVPMTAPRLDLDPSDQSLMLPPDTVEGEPGPLIYHVDPTEFEEKPWRRPGADLTDWFNYGFNEDSWKLWGEKKHNRTVERIDMETNGGRQDMYNDAGNEQNEHNNNDTSSGYMAQMPSQQLQAMQAMMGASGMSMPPEQMMAFMGMGPGAMPGMGMGGGPMMGMPGMPGMPGMSGMGGMFGQQNTNQGGFQGGFGNMPMMPQSFQRGPPPTHGLPMRPADSMASVEEEPSSGPEGNRQAHSESNGNAADTINDLAAPASDSMGQGNSQSATVEHSADEVPSNAPRGPRGTGVPGAPTGPSRGGSSAVPSTTAAPLPSNVPTGPKHPGRRYNDRDTGMGIADSLDYGAGQGNAHREGSMGLNRSRSPDRRKASRSRDVSTDRDRDYDRERGGRDRDDSDGRTTLRIKRDRTTSDRRRHSSPEDELERLSKKSTSRRADPKKQPSSTSQRYSGSRRDERRRSDSQEREDEWDRESVDSSASRRRTTTSSRQQQAPRASTRSDRRRGGDENSGSETEKERKYGRSQARAERRAGRDGDDAKSTTSSRKRGAPEEDASPVRASSSRKRR